MSPIVASGTNSCRMRWSNGRLTCAYAAQSTASLAAVGETIRWNVSISASADMISVASFDSSSNASAVRPEGGKSSASHPAGSLRISVLAHRPNECGVNVTAGRGNQFPLLSPVPSAICSSRGVRR